MVSKLVSDWKLDVGCSRKGEFQAFMTSIYTSPGAPGTTLNENCTLGTLHFRHFSSLNIASNFISAIRYFLLLEGCFMAEKKDNERIKGRIMKELKV
ncbi:MAG: hypothetical protein ABIL62_06205, partial [Planctomycetota bacterium]